MPTRLPAGTPLTHPAVHPIVQHPVLYHAPEGTVVPLHRAITAGGHVVYRPGVSTHPLQRIATPGAVPPAGGTQVDASDVVVAPASGGGGGGDPGAAGSVSPDAAAPPPGGPTPTPVPATPGAAAAPAPAKGAASVATSSKWGWIALGGAGLYFLLRGAG